MMMQSNDLTRLLSFDTTKNSKLNLARVALSFNNHEDSPVSSITVLFSNESNGLRVVLSRSPSLANEREARAKAWQWSSILPGPEITGKVYGCFEKRVIAPGKVSR